MIIFWNWLIYWKRTNIFFFTNGIEPVVGSGDGSSSGLSDEEKEIEVEAGEEAEEGEDDDDEGNIHDDHQSDTASDPELILTCFVLMLDVAYKQVSRWEHKSLKEVNFFWPS